MNTTSPDRFLEFQRRLADEVHLGGELFEELRHKRTDLIRKLAWRYLGRARAWQIQVRLRKRPEGILITSKPQEPLCGWIFISLKHWPAKVFTCEEQVDIHSKSPARWVYELLPDRISRKYSMLKEPTEKAFLALVCKIVVGDVKPFLEKEISAPEKPKLRQSKKKSTSRPLFTCTSRGDKNEPVSISFTKRGFARVVRLAELAGKLKERQRTYLPEHRDKLDGLIELALDFESQLRACPGIETPLRKDYGDRVDGLTKQDYWIFFKSPASTWRQLCGRAGWYVIDYQTLRIKAFVKTMMN
jgi:hypothetical protein